MARMAGTPGTPRVLRAMNDRAALDLLLEHGPLSRTRIGKLTGLSKPTASQLLARLEAAGLVLATGTSEGRPSPPLRDGLAARLPMRVEYENDVNLAAIAEQRLGAARGHGDFVLLWSQ